MRRTTTTMTMRKNICENETRTIITTTKIEEKNAVLIC
jgi:hypothetical protein